MRRPNFLIIYTDQQRWDALGASGNPQICTPHLDRLARASVSFDHCFVQNPVCMPSRLSFLTGQYPSTLGVTHMGVPVPEDTVTLPRLLAPYGYRSANIGKLHFQPHANRDHRTHHPAYGFHHLEISNEPGSYEDAYRAWVRRHAPDQLPFISWGLAPMTEVWQQTMGLQDGIDHPAERFPKRPLPARCRDDITHTAFVAEQSIEFMRQQAHSGQHFLCIAGIYSPHSPWVAPQKYFDLYDPASLTLPSYPPEVDAQRNARNFPDEELRLARQGYYGQVSEVDHHVGRMLAALEELGLAEDTVVIFTSDHGEWLGEHLRYGKGYPAHDQCSRVPLLMRLPGNAAPGRTDSGLTEALDVLPTILDLAAIPDSAPPAGPFAPAASVRRRTRRRLRLDRAYRLEIAADRPFPVRPPRRRLRMSLRSVCRVGRLPRRGRRGSLRLRAGRCSPPAQPQAAGRGEAAAARMALLRRL